MDKRNMIIDSLVKTGDIDAVARDHGVSVSYVRTISGESGAGKLYRHNRDLAIAEDFVKTRDDYSKIAGRFHVSPAKVYQTIRRLVVPTIVATDPPAITYYSDMVRFNKRGVRTNSQRNIDLLELFDAGESLQKIGDKFGITRERVRQIAARNGRTPKMVTARVNMERRKRSIMNARKRRRRERDELIDLCVRLIKEHKSLDKVATLLDTSKERVRKLIAERGVRSTGHSRWHTDHKLRSELILGRDKSKTLQSEFERIAAIVTEREGHNITGKSLQMWYYGVRRRRPEYAE